MELIEALVLIELVIAFLLFMFCLFLFAKVNVLTAAKPAEKVFEDLMKNKIPILRDSNTGEFIMPKQPKLPKGKNPIVG